MAADVTLYGALDTGFEYFHHKTTNFDGTSVKDDTFDMQTGWDTPSRWGLKGSEDLGNGYKVSFKLESGFNSDDGTMGQSNRLFGRGSRSDALRPVRFCCLRPFRRYCLVLRHV